MRKKYAIGILLLLFIIFLPVFLIAATKTVSGSITSVESGDGSVGTTIKINIGSSSGLSEGSLGWVSKGDETIAYIKVISVNNDTASAIITAHENINKVISGLIVNFNVNITEPKPKPKKEPESDRRPNEIKIIQDHLHSCLEEIAWDALDYVKFFGGYIYDKPEYTVLFRGNDVTYAYYEGKIVYPPLEKTESEIEDYMVYNFSPCIKTDSYSYEFDIREPLVSVRIDEDKVHFKVFYSMTLKKKGSSYDLVEEYEFDEYVRLGHFYKLMEKIAAKTKEVGYVLDMDFLFSLNIRIFVFELDNKILVYRIADEKPDSPYKEYFLTFGVKFSE